MMLLNGLPVDGASLELYPLLDKIAGEVRCQFALHCFTCQDTTAVWSLPCFMMASCYCVFGLETASTQHSVLYIMIGICM